LVRGKEDNNVSLSGKLMRSHSLDRHNCEGSNEKGKKGRTDREGHIHLGPGERAETRGSIRGGKGNLRKGGREKWQEYRLTRIMQAYNYRRRSKPERS